MFLWVQEVRHTGMNNTEKDSHRVYGIQHILSATPLLVSICQFVHRDRYAEVREVGLRRQDLGREVVRAQSIVVQRLRAKLHDASNVFGLRYSVQGREEGVAPSDPFI